MIFRHIYRPVCICGALMLIAGCNNTVATDKPTNGVEAETVTRAQCLALDTKELKIDCLKKLSKQNKSGLTQLDKSISQTEARNKKLREKNEAALKQLERDVLETDKPD